jgi:heme A synthase
MKKKLIAIVLVLTLVSLFAIVPAEAGSKTRYRLPGAGIALGALLLGGLVAHHMAAHAFPPSVVYAPPPEPRYFPPEPEWVPGHWQISREWVPGTWEKIWIPGHYDRRGNRVAGYYISRQNPGHYEERRVWVEGYYRQR